MDVVVSGLILVGATTAMVYLADAVVSSRRGRIWGRWLALLVAAVMLAAGCLLLGLAAFDDRSTVSAGLVLLLLGGSLGLVLSGYGRAAIARLFPLDRHEPRDWLGLLVLVWLVILNRLTIDSDGDGDVSAVSNAEAVIQMLLLVGVTCGVIGLFVRRDARQSLNRLGIRRPDLRVVSIAALTVIPFAVGAGLTALLVDYLQPGTLDRLEETVSGMTGGETSWQLGLMLGITAAIGEESLFRGALQPKYGLVFTALVFAMIHAQYDLLLVLGSLFPAGLILGLERKYLGTTAAIITHALYNLISVIGSV